MEKRKEGFEGLRKRRKGGWMMYVEIVKLGWRIKKYE